MRVNVNKGNGEEDCMIEKPIASVDPQTVEEVKEFWIKDLGQTDSIFIKTQNASYCFKITDPQQQRGILTGGNLRFHHYRATLLDYQRKTATGAPEQCPVLQVGLSAAFELDLPGSKKQVITSPVTEVLIVRIVRQTRRQKPKR